VLAGYDPIEMRAGWRQPWPAGKRVIDLVAQDVQHGMHHATTIVEGHVGTALTWLTALLPLAPSAIWTDGLPGRVRAQLRDAFTPATEWGPGVVFETLRAVAPPETVTTADSGAHRILLSQSWRCALPRTLLQSTGLCTMGCALPLAAGAALGTGKPALCFVGDAGLEMVLGELATVRDLGLPVVVVVLVDASLGLIALKQRQSQLPNLGVDFGATDFPAVARAMGGYGVMVTGTADLDREARAAFARQGFTVIACAIDRLAYDGAF
jgi:acetolactate synthase-1/2/3 large subunit